MEGSPGAAVVLAYLRPRVARQREETMQSLLRQHYDGTLTEQGMRAAIAELAALQKLLQQAERDATQERTLPHGGI